MSSDAANDGSVCMMNIGPRERMKRMRFGMAAMGAGLVVTGVLVAMQVHHAIRLCAFLPFFAGAIGIFQAREKT